MKNTVRSISLGVFTTIIFLSNLVPILGPIIISGGIGYNEKRFRRSCYNIKRKSLIISILTGNLLYFLIIGILIDYIIELEHQSYFWLIIFSGFLISFIFSIIFYFIGKKRYDKKRT